MNTTQSSKKKGRLKSRLLIRSHYHDKEWQSPYRLYAQLLTQLLGPSSAVLDVGCGRNFPMAETLKATKARVYGLDPVAAREADREGVTIRRGAAENIPYDSNMFDVVTSCAVLEHMVTPVRAFAEFNRVLTPGGRVLFLTANRYDYVSIIARLVPNRYHQWLVKSTEMRNEADTFPTFYRANTIRDIRKIAKKTGFQVERVHYLNQYPYALAFSPVLCRLGIAYDWMINRVSWLNWLDGWILGVLQCKTKLRRESEA